MPYSPKQMTLIVLGSLGLLVGALILGGYLAERSFYAGSGPARPCEERFAAGLTSDPLYDATPPQTRPTDYTDQRGGCADEEDGGVSYAEREYLTTLEPAAVIEHYRKLAVHHGWQNVTPSIPARGDYNLCANRTTPDGHTIVFWVQMFDTQQARYPVGTRNYDLGFTGDLGDPTC